MPILVAWGRQVIQNRIAAEGMRKDYVTLAVGILTKKKDEQPDIELRQWAVDIVDKNSPAPLPASLKWAANQGLRGILRNASIRTSAENGLRRNATQPISIARFLNDSL